MEGHTVLCLLVASVWGRRSQPGVILCPVGHLAMLGDLYHPHDWRALAVIWRVQARDAAEILHRTQQPPTENYSV